MRNALTVIVTMVCVYIFTALLPTAPPGTAQAQDEAAAPQEPMEPPKELRTYDINDLIAVAPHFADVPNLKGERPKPDYEHMILLPGSVDPDVCPLPRPDRITAVEDMIKVFMPPGDPWALPTKRGLMEELDGVLYLQASVADHEEVARVLAKMRSMKHRSVSVQWLAFEISTDQLHELKKRFADGGLLISAPHAKSLLDELETGKLKNTPVASARWVCMNGQRTWTMPMEKRSAATDKDDKGNTTISEVCRTGTFDVKPVLTGDHASIWCTAAVAIAAAPADDQAGPTETRQYEFQSTVIIPDGGGVLMTASNGKTAQAGREIVVLLQVQSVPAPGTGTAPEITPGPITGSKAPAAGRDVEKE